MGASNYHQKKQLQGVSKNSYVAIAAQKSAMATNSKPIYRKFMFSGVIYSVGEFALFRET